VAGLDRVQRELELLRSNPREMAVSELSSRSIVVRMMGFGSCQAHGARLSLTDQPTMRRQQVSSTIAR
jgi:hypothetical protein